MNLETQALYTQEPQWLDATKLCQLVYHLTRDSKPEYATLRKRIRRLAVASTSLTHKTLQAQSKEEYEQHLHSCSKVLLELFGQLCYASLIANISNKELRRCRQLCKSLKKDLNCGWDYIKTINNSTEKTAKENALPQGLANIA